MPLPILERQQIQNISAELQSFSQHISKNAAHSYHKGFLESGGNLDFWYSQFPSKAGGYPNEKLTLKAYLTRIYAFAVLAAHNPTIWQQVSNDQDDLPLLHIRDLLTASKIGLFLNAWIAATKNDRETLTINLSGFSKFQGLISWPEVVDILGIPNRILFCTSAELHEVDNIGQLLCDLSKASNLTGVPLKIFSVRVSAQNIFERVLQVIKGSQQPPHTFEKIAVFGNVCFSHEAARHFQDIAVHHLSWQSAKPLDLDLQPLLANHHSLYEISTNAEHPFEPNDVQRHLMGLTRLARTLQVLKKILPYAKEQDIAKWITLEKEAQINKRSSLVTAINQKLAVLRTAKIELPQEKKDWITSVLKMQEAFFKSLIVETDLTDNNAKKKKVPAKTVTFPQGQQTLERIKYFKRNDEPIMISNDMTVEEKVVAMERRHAEQEENDGQVEEAALQEQYFEMDASSVVTTFVLPIADAVVSPAPTVLAIKPKDAIPMPTESSQKHLPLARRIVLDKTYNYETFVQYAKSDADFADLFRGASEAAKLVNTIADIIYGEAQQEGVSVVDSIAYVNTAYEIISVIVNDGEWKEDAINKYVWDIIEYALRNNRPEWLQYVFDIIVDFIQDIISSDKKEKVDLTYPLEIIAYIDQEGQLSPKIEEVLARNLVAFSEDISIWNKLIEKLVNSKNVANFFDRNKESLSDFNRCAKGDYENEVNLKPLYKAAYFLGSEDLGKFIKLFKISSADIQNTIATLTKERSKANNNTVTRSYQRVIDNLRTALNSLNASQNSALSKAKDEGEPTGEDEKSDTAASSSTSYKRRKTEVAHDQQPMDEVTTTTVEAAQALTTLMWSGLTSPVKSGRESVEEAEVRIARERFKELIATNQLSQAQDHLIRNVEKIFSPVKSFNVDEFIDQILAIATSEAKELYAHFTLFAIHAGVEVDNRRKLGCR